MAQRRTCFLVCIPVSVFSFMLLHSLLKESILRFSESVPRHEIDITLRLRSLEAAVAQLGERMNETDEINSRLVAKTEVKKGDKCHLYTRDSELTHAIVKNAWKSQQKVEPKDITLVTQLTVQRLPSLEQILKQWLGPVSASVYIEPRDLKNFPSFVKMCPLLMARTNIDLHLAGQTKFQTYYPINFMRNVALNNSWTDYVINLDVDFIPPNTMYETLRETISKGLPINVGLILPAFEVMTHMGSLFPNNKSELLKLWNRELLHPVMQYRLFKPGHAPTNFDKWKTTNASYSIGKSFPPSFEPYFCARKSVLPPFNEGFVGVARDKISHSMASFFHGVEFRVDPNNFVVHVPHMRPTKEKTSVALNHQCGYFLFVRYLSHLKKKFPNRTLQKK